MVGFIVFYELSWHNQYFCLPSQPNYSWKNYIYSRITVTSDCLHIYFFPPPFLIHLISYDTHKVDADSYVAYFFLQDFLTLVAIIYAFGLVKIYINSSDSQVTIY